MIISSLDRKGKLDNIELYATIFRCIFSARKLDISTKLGYTY